MISIINTSRRPEKYLQLVESLEEQANDLIDNYICFVNEPDIIKQYQSIKNKFSKIRIVEGKKDYIFRHGFGQTYNLLQSLNKSKFNLILFDSDIVTINADKLKEDLEKDGDLYGFKVYMERGDSLETKYQLYKNDKLLTWIGHVHENQIFSRQPKVIEIESIKVEHKNAIDKSSQNLKKDKDGFIILEKTEEGSDSHERNLLYETLTYRIVHENLSHQNRGWFVEHYKRNKEVIDSYFNEARNKNLI